MHEVSLAGEILRIVEDAAAKQGCCRVAEVRIEAGALAGVDVQALRFALEAIAPQTCLMGAKLRIDEPPGTARCEQCGCDVEIDTCHQPCPRCNHYPLTITGGNELRVIDIGVVDA